LTKRALARFSGEILQSKRVEMVATIPTD